MGEKAEGLTMTLDFGLAHDLQEVAFWIVSHSSTREAAEPLAIVNRAIDRLRGTAQDRWSQHDIEWLLRNDAFVATIAAHVGKYLERKSQHTLSVQRRNDGGENA